MINILYVLAALLLSGCVHSIHQHHVGDFSPNAQNGKEIEALSVETVILNFTFDTDYVEKAYQELQSKCPKGDIVAVSTQLSSSLGFFHYKNKAYMTGRCITADDAEVGTADGKEKKYRKKRKLKKG